jgi:hypothetical protein
MKRKVFTLIGLVCAVLGAYLFVVNDESDAPKTSETENIKELVHNYSAGNIEDQSASITSHQLLVTDSDGVELTYDLPEDDFFVSIAPYVDKTHPCTVHNLTGCQGEMAEKEFDVYIEDMDGNVILDKTMKSQSNGFIDLWLPRDQTYRTTITHDGKMVESELSTFENDGTCITTMQLT